ncbi:MAG: hypothetical protein AABW49_01160 [Nanoarchaeota archaeon]
MNITKIIKKVVYILFLASLIYVIFELTRKILGGSLEFEDLVIALLVANLGYSFYLQRDISTINEKLSGHIG